MSRNGTSQQSCFKRALSEPVVGFCSFGVTCHSCCFFMLRKNEKERQRESCVYWCETCGEFMNANVNTGYEPTATVFATCSLYWTYSGEQWKPDRATHSQSIGTELGDLDRCWSGVRDIMCCVCESCMKATAHVYQYGWTTFEQVCRMLCAQVLWTWQIQVATCKCGNFWPWRH